MDSRKLARRVRELAENKKAEDTVILDMRKLTSVADYFVVTTGTSQPHLRAIGEEIVDQLQKELDLPPAAVEGNLGSSWVVLDYTEVIVHLMRADIRARYDLESLWRDAPRVRSRRLRAPATAHKTAGSPTPAPRLAAESR